MKLQLFVIFLATVLLTNCDVQRNYYLLAPQGAAPSGGSIGLGVGPVSLAPYLTERPNLIFKSSAHKLEFSDEHVWAGDLEKDFTRVLGIELGRQMSTGRIRNYPWDREGELDYQVTINVVRFHGTENGEAVLEANWRIYALPEGRLVTDRNTTLTEPLRVDGFEELAASQSRLVSGLAAGIAKSLR